MVETRYVIDNTASLGFLYEILTLKNWESSRQCGTSQWQKSPSQKYTPTDCFFGDFALWVKWSK